MKQSKAWLTYARKHAEHSQRSLSEAVGVSRSAVYLYEKGICVPNLRVQKKIAKELGIPLNWFHERPAQANY